MGKQVSIRKLEESQEWLAADRLIANAFLHPWDEEQERRKVQEQAAGNVARPEETWALEDDAGVPQTAITTLSHRMWLGGRDLPVGEVHMVGSRMENRGGGNVRALMGAVLEDFRDRGDVFAVLIPFSFSFYRKFGFELAARTTRYRIPIEQLADLPCDYVVTKVETEQDVAPVRALHEDVARSHDMCLVYEEADWRWRGNGMFGEPDFIHPDRQTYTYVLWDKETPVASVTFSFTHAPDNPFFGKAEVSDLTWRDPGALKGTLEFLYRLRAKVGSVRLELPCELDVAAVLPEPDKIQCSLGGHVMARVLNVPEALRAMPHPKGPGSYVLAVHDALIPQNDGAWQVTFGDGEVRVSKAPDASPDLELSEAALAQLVSGVTGLATSQLRTDVQVHKGTQTLARVFTRRPSWLEL